MKKLSTNFWPLLGSGVASGVAVPLALLGRPEAHFQSASSTLTGISATILGFVLTSLAILSALPNQVFLRNMQKAGHLRMLLTELFGTSLIFLLVTAFGLVYFLLPNYLACRLTIVSVALFLFGIVALALAGYKFHQVLTHA